MSKTPKLNNTYQLGDYIFIDVEFDDAVTVIPDWVNPQTKQTAIMIFRNCNSGSMGTATMRPSPEKR